jgi:hypothetical protein
MTTPPLPRFIDAWQQAMDTARPWSPAPPPDGVALLNRLEAYLARFVAYPSDAARVAHTCWIAHTHLMECWDSTPRLAFLSPEPGSGKTRALEVSELLVPRPVEAVNMSAAALFRIVAGDEGMPTILFDEVDTVFGSKRTAENNEDVRGLLNAGHRRGAKSYRCTPRGKEIAVVEYEAFSPVALAGLGDLPDTILSRSIIVKMRRRAPRERVDPFRRRLEVTAGHALRDELAEWAQSVAPQIGNPWPTMPAGIEDRDADVWEAILAVADAAGGSWPERARAAAVALVADAKEDTPSLGVQLLSDIRDVFGDADALSTELLLSRLNDLDEAPWNEVAAGKPLNSRGLAGRLRPYGIRSRTVRIGSTTPKGYARESFGEAWNRYLPPTSAESATSATSATPGENPSNDAGNGVAETLRKAGDVADGNATREESATYPQQETLNNGAGNGPIVADVADVAAIEPNKEPAPNGTPKRLVTATCPECLAANRVDLTGGKCLICDTALTAKVA